jgi:hypothetical protein
VISGYLVPLRWTGFTGNTAWDWIKLLLVLALGPTELLPFVTDAMRRRLIQDSTIRDEPATDPSQRDTAGTESVPARMTLRAKGISTD